MASKTVRLVPGIGLVVETNTVATELYPGGFYIQPSVSGITATTTGTSTASITEAEVVTGGKTTIITITGDTLVAHGAAFNHLRQDIIDGCTSAQSELLGWNNEVRDSESVASVSRTDDNTITITWSAAPNYDITAQEAITVTIPAAVLVNSLVDVVASPSFTVDPVTNYDIEALPGSYTLLGTSAALLYSREVALNSGIYTLSGTAASLSRDSRLAVDSGSYSLQGATAELIAAFVLAATSGSYAVSGSPVDFLTSYILELQSGSYSTVGQSVGLLRDLVGSADVGAYSVTGTAANLIATSDQTLSAASGAYILTGSQVALIRDGLIGAASGSYALSGSDLSLVIGTILEAATGSYSITGEQATLLKSVLVSLDSGTYTTTGYNAALGYSGEVIQGYVMAMLLGL